MPAERVAELTLAGSPDQVREHLAVRHPVGATSVVLPPVEADGMTALPRPARVLDRR